MTDFEKKFNELGNKFDARYAEASAYLASSKEAFNNIKCHTPTKIHDDAFSVTLPNSTFQQTVNNNDLLFQQHVSENNMQQFMQQSAADLGAFMHQQMFMGI